MVDHHSQKRSDDDPRVDLSENAVFLPRLYVTAKEVIDLANEGLEKSFSDLVSFKCRIKDHPHKRDIFLMFV